MSVSTAPMSSVDRAWLLMERRTNPMMVVGLVTLERPLRLPELRAVVARRFLAAERFRARPAGELLAAQWVSDSEFDLDDHVHAIALPAPAGRVELERLVGELASEPLSQARPRWSFHLVTNFRGGAALIIRVHHCYADGIALMRVFLGMTDPLDPPPADQGAQAPRATGDAAAAAAAAAGGAAGSDSIGTSLGSLLVPIALLASKGLRLASHPAEAVETVRTAGGLALALAQLAGLSDEPPTRLKRTLGGTKRVAWAEPLPLGEVKTVARLLGCTVNEVVMSTLSGALGRFLQESGERIDALHLRVAMPVNLRSAAVAATSLGNDFGLCFVDLPISVAHPLERLQAMHDTLHALLDSAQPLLVYGLLAAIGALPAPLEDPAIELFSAKASAVVSNVPGPTGKLCLAGAPIHDLLFWVPQSGSIGLGISILSYAGQLQFAVIADRRIVGQPHRLTDLFAPEFERLVRFVLIGALAHDACRR